jgi:pyridoxal 5'-phosphate synthase pdxS subunit
MALERVPSDIRKEAACAAWPTVKDQGDHGDRVDPRDGQGRIGHFVEAQVLEALGVDYIDESEVLTPADDRHPHRQVGFRTPFVCGCRNLGEALRRIGEGAAMIRTKGEAGSGNIVEAVRHMREVQSTCAKLHGMRTDELMAEAKDWARPTRSCRWVRSMQAAGANFRGGSAWPRPPMRRS